MKKIVGISALVLIATGYWLDRSGADRSLMTASVAASNFAQHVAITKADWYRDGIGGTVAVADFGVRNNNDFAIRVDAVTCKFRKGSNDVEERTSTTYEIIQPRDQRTIRNLGFGFIDADRSSDCMISKAQKV